MSKMSKQEYESYAKSSDTEFKELSEFIVAQNKVTLCKINIGGRSCGIYYAYRMNEKVIPPKFDGMRPLFRLGDYPILFMYASPSNEYRMICMRHDYLDVYQYGFDNLSYEDYLKGVGDPELCVTYKMTPGQDNKYDLWDSLNETEFKTTFEITGVTTIINTGAIETTPVFPTPSAKMATIVFE